MAAGVGSVMGRASTSRLRHPSLSGSHALRLPQADDAYLIKTGGRRKMTNRCAQLHLASARPPELAKAPAIAPILVGSCLVMLSPAENLGRKFSAGVLD